jgi:AcrR family transcriptional regulator
MRRRLSPDEIRERIVDAAGEMFGRHGFHGTTIRQITKHAGVNVAAVNYHFRDKDELYLRVLREAKNCTRLMPPAAFDGAPSDQLRGFIFSLVGQMLDPARPAWHVQVITQEMMRPTPALDVLVREMTEPVFHHLRQAVGAVVGRKLPRAQLDLITSSILGQCLFYVRSRPMIARVAPELSRGPDRIERIAEHIATFSLAGLCHLYGKPTNRGRVPALHAS